MSERPRVTSPFGGPVSAALETDLRDFVRRHRVVVWLDLDCHYSDFVQRLIAARAAERLGYQVLTWRGSFLELMLELEDRAGGCDPELLVVHLPGCNEESVHLTPLYELYAAGKRYRKALATMVTEAAAGRVRPELIVDFKAQPDLSLARADQWLAARLDDHRQGLAGLEALGPTAVLDDLLGADQVVAGVRDEVGDPALWEWLRAWVGLPVTWQETTQLQERARAKDLAFAVASWALCVEYVDDLSCQPVSDLLAGIGDLPNLVIATCHTIAAHLRDHHPKFYQATADQTEALLADEIAAARAEDLGQTDTFRFEDDRFLAATLTALDQQQWDQAAEWAGPRVASDSFWLLNDVARGTSWQLAAAAARLGQAIAAAGDRLAVDSGLEAAVQRYVARGAAVDQAHRRLEQHRRELLTPELAEFATLRTLLDDLRTVWRCWADKWAEDFNRLCQSHGFLPPPSLQQRTLFDDVVQPLAIAGVTAYFVIDGFRYEMAEELVQRLANPPATTVSLAARLAELPTVTAVGMNVLAPVANHGHLVPALSDRAVLGFACGEFRVNSPSTRKQAMHNRVGGTTCPWLSLAEVLARDSVSLKRTVARARLLVVHSQGIDSAGEKGLGPAVFDSVLRDLRAAWHLLRDAGVRRFVLTADHGFLLLDDGSEAQAHGRLVDPKRRHVLSPLAADHDGEVRVALAELDYHQAPGHHLMFPTTTALFATGRRGSTGFAHGGNSLQERVIPVLTLVHRAPAGARTLTYTIHAEARAEVAGMHCLEIRVEVVAQQELDYGAPRKVELALRVPDPAGVRVELCQVRGSGQLEGGTVSATPDQSCELFFRLTGNADARVLVELYHPNPGAKVAPCIPDARFAVTPARLRPEPAAAPEPAPPQPMAWLEQIPEEGARRLFTQLAEHGVVTEVEAVKMLGGHSRLRRFSIRFEKLASKAPFAVRIDAVAGVKRYVREGSS